MRPRKYEQSYVAGRRLTTRRIFIGVYESCLNCNGMVLLSRRRFGLTHEQGRKAHIVTKMVHIDVAIHELRVVVFVDLSGFVAGVKEALREQVLAAAVGAREARKRRVRCWRCGVGFADISDFFFRFAVLG
jgi:hypothetical protein